MDEDLKAVNSLKCCTRTGSTIEKMQVTKRILLIMSQGCQRMCTQLMSEYALETRLQSMKARNPDKKDSFQYSLGFIYYNTTELEHALKRTLDCCMSLCNIAAMFQGLECLTTKSKFVKLHTQANFKQLVPAELVEEFVDLDDVSNSIYCNKESNKYKEITYMSCITGDELYKALGFTTLKAQRQIFLNLGNKGNIGNAITTYENMDAENSALEVNAISTIVALLMPALMPPCMTFKQVGPQFVHGTNCYKMMVSIVDGIIKCNSGQTCSNISHSRHYNQTLVMFHYASCEKESK